MSERYVAQVRIAAEPERVFAFHTDPENLLRITPPGMKVEVAFQDPMAPGARVVLRVRPLPLVVQLWEMEFDVYEPPHRMRDVQRRGPFRLWQQTRTFRAERGGTLLVDEVEYELPFGILGRVANALVVRRQIRGMFAYRQKRTKELIESQVDRSGKNR